MPIKKSFLIPLLAGLVLSAGLWWLYAVDPAGNVFAPKCPFYLFTGWECPGCGSQRTLHDLLHLRFNEAFAHNPFLLISLPYLGVLAAGRWFNPSGRLDRLNRFCHHPLAIRGYLAALILWWILRNICI